MLQKKIMGQQSWVTWTRKSFDYIYNTTYFFAQYFLSSQSHVNNRPALSLSNFLVELSNVRVG